MNSSKDRSTPLRRALGITLPLCLFSLFLSGIVISITNDMYAFVKPEREVVLSIDKSMTPDELSELLQRENVIKNAFAFKLYLHSKDKDSEIPALRGEWQLSSDMSYREIVSQILK